MRNYAQSSLCYIIKERSHSGLVHRLGRAAYRKVSWVQIPPSPPSFTFSEIERGCLGASRLGMVFPRENPSIFEGERKRPLGNAEVRTNLFEKIPNPFGIFLLSVFFGLVGLFEKSNGKFEPIIALSPKSRDFFFQILFSENELVFFGGIFRLRQIAVQLQIKQTIKFCFYLQKLISRFLGERAFRLGSIQFLFFKVRN